MAIDTCTNFVSATSTVLDWARARVNTVGTLADTCEIFEQANEQQIFSWIHKATRNQAVVQYDGSTYNRDGSPRRVLKFNVWVVYRYTTNRISGQTSAVTLMDSVIAALDHETSADFMCYVVADTAKDFPHAGLSVYLASFVVEDY